MAVMKKSTRKKLSKQLNKLIKQHGAEMALALVTGIVSALASERSTRTAKNAKKSTSGKRDKAEKADNAPKGEKAPKAAKLEKAPARTVIIRKRA
jgi:hypothetical protein